MFVWIEFAGLVLGNPFEKKQTSKKQQQQNESKLTRKAPGYVITRMILLYRLDEGLYRCEAIDNEDSCTYYFTTQTEENSKNFVLFVQKDKGNCSSSSFLLLC